jgi:ADP-ribose pyrophosphatase YjhB (NUDIX family)
MGAQTKFLRLSKLRGLCETEQVAAVCYRMRGEDIEFLLVQTGGGRWIFPKGSVEPGLTHAQAAAIEAFEEAGVHGRIEEEAFCGYRARKQNARKQTVMAHLCEVLRLGSPQEPGRNRTWFTAEKAKRRLGEDRSKDEGSELARVVSRAVIRIAQLRNNVVPTPEVAAHHKTHGDPLQKVQFESAGPSQSQGKVNALYMRYIRRLRSDEQPGVDGEISSFLSKPRFRLGSGNPPPAAMQKVTAIDQARGERGKARS